jgi:hypothetical protein
VEIPLDDAKFTARFQSYLDADTREWFGYCNEDDDRIFTTTDPTRERVKFRAYPVTWALHNHRQPTGVIRHARDTPPCCDPACLLDGTQHQNISDRDDPARSRYHRKMVLVGQGELPLGQLC